MKKIVFLLFGMLLFVMDSSAQIISTPMNENLIKGRVKQIDEFMKRFNMEETWDGQKIKDRSDKQYRRKYLKTLFEESTYHSINNDKNGLADAFIEEIVRNDYQLKYEDSTWIAEVACTAMIGNTKQQIKLYLHTQIIRPGEYKWVISNVYGKPFEVNQEQRGPIISPMEHEIGFIGLMSVPYYQKTNLCQLMDNSFNADKLSILYALMHNNLMKIERIDNVCFHFLTIPNFSFKVERIEKKGSFNTGWLITKLNRI